jgi:hypothetical protein
MRRPKTITVPTVQPTRSTRYLILFILVKRSTYFGRSIRPSSGAENWIYSNGIRQTAVAICCYRGWNTTVYSFILTITIFDLVAYFFFCNNRSEISIFTNKGPNLWLGCKCENSTGYIVKKNIERSNSKNKLGTTAQGIVFKIFSKRSVNLMCSSKSNIKGIH